MAGGGTDDPLFLEKKFLASAELRWLHFWCLSGFVLEIYAIVKKSKD